MNRRDILKSVVALPLVALTAERAGAVGSRYGTTVTKSMQSEHLGGKREVITFEYKPETRYMTAAVWTRDKKRVIHAKAYRIEPDENFERGVRRAQTDFKLSWMSYVQSQLRDYEYEHMAIHGPVGTDYAIMDRFFVEA